MRAQCPRVQGINRRLNRTNRRTARMDAKCKSEPRKINTARELDSRRRLVIIARVTISRGVMHSRSLDVSLEKGTILSHRQMPTYPDVARSSTHGVKIHVIAWTRDDDLLRRLTLQTVTDYGNSCVFAVPFRFDFHAFRPRWRWIMKMKSPFVFFLTRDDLYIDSLWICCGN